MKTIEELQAAVDEIRAVCAKHGIVLIGTCESEGIYGEITIGENRPDCLAWMCPNDQLTNVVVVNYDNYHEKPYYKINGIGELK